jgi:hypothetical protein
MLALSEQPNLRELGDRLGDAHAATAGLMSEIVGEARRRYPSIGQTEKTARIDRLIASNAWTDAALALIDLELPQWQVRRIVYDEGEWHCALSRQRELPDWLDQSIEARHTDLPLAILGAYADARGMTSPASKASVPPVPFTPGSFYEPVCCDDFS